MFDLQMGKTPSRNNPEYWNSEDHKWISIGDLSKCGKYILDTKEYLSDTAVQESGISCIPANTVIMSFKLSIGKTAITKEPIYSNEAIMSFRDKHIVELLPDYIFYMFTGKDWEAGTNKAVMGKTLNKATLSAIKVSIHPISEQRRIVEVLDKASSIIEDRQRELTRLDELIRARFVEMFGDPGCNEKGWPTKPLLSMGFCKNGMNFHYDDSGVELNCLGVGDFKDYSIIADTATLPTVSLNEMPSPEYLLQDDDIVFVRSNGNKKMVGRSVAVYPGSVPTTFSGFCIRFRRNDDLVITPYLLRVLKAESMRQKMYGRGANIQNLNQHTLSSLYIPVPPKTMQEEFATFVAQVDKSKYQAEPNSRKYHIHRLRKQYQELTDSLFLYFTKLFEVIILQKGIC